jgi:hypothetical protein
MTISKHRKVSRTARVSQTIRLKGHQSSSKWVLHKSLLDPLEMAKLCFFVFFNVCRLKLLMKLSEHLFISILNQHTNQNINFLECDEDVLHQRCSRLYWNCDWFVCKIECADLCAFRLCLQNGLRESRLAFQTILRREALWKFEVVMFLSHLLCLWWETKCYGIGENYGDPERSTHIVESSLYSTTVGQSQWPEEVAPSVSITDSGSPFSFYFTVSPHILF